MDKNKIGIGSYWGGKNLANGRIQKEICKHSCFVEMFAGSMAVLLNKPRSKFEIANELGKGCSTFWKVLRDRPYELIAKIEMTPFSRNEYNDIIAADDTEDEVEIARRWFCRLRMSFHPRADEKQFTPTHAESYFSARERLDQVAARLKNVILENTDGLNLLKRNEYFFNYNVCKYDGDFSRILVFADPPYLKETQKTKQNYYGLESGEREWHEKFLAMVNEYSAKGFRFLICGYPSDLYEKELSVEKGWRREEYTKQEAQKKYETDEDGISRVSQDSFVTETMWMNYKKNQTDWVENANETNGE